MSNALNTCTAQETAACCCVDVGTVIDNTDCTASYSQHFTFQADAQAMLASLSARAQAVASDPCVITSRLTESPQGVELACEFTFCCQAESLIFQLALR